MWGGGKGAEAVLLGVKTSIVCNGGLFYLVYVTIHVGGIMIHDSSGE